MTSSLSLYQGALCPEGSGVHFIYWFGLGSIFAGICWWIRNGRPCSSGRFFVKRYCVVDPF